MKNSKKRIFPAMMLGLLLCLGACSEMDEYKEFTEGGEISYTEKMDSIKVYSGRNRALIEGVITADPKVSEYRIYWNTKKDSVVIPVDRSDGVDTLTTIIENLPENIYNFEIRTFDEMGNQSIPVYATGEVYGERYQGSLIQRPLVSNVLIGNNLTINYGGMDRTSGVLGTQVNYTSVDDGQQSLFVPVDSSNVFIENFMGGTDYQYRTVFLPELTSIDTFYTGYESFTPQFKLSDPPYFQNAHFPFVAADDGGRWATPAHWIHNEAALSHNGYGAMDGNAGDRFSLESGWGQPDIINGKVYQTFVLPPGDYAYIIDIAETNYEGADNNLDHAYFTVAQGSTLPDVAAVETSDATIAYERINKVNGLKRTVFFTITEISQVSIGVQTTNDQGAGRYLKINSFALGQITEAPYLKNAAVPFDAAATNGRWGTLADWTTNDAAKNHSGLGGWDEWNGNIFNLESGWGAPEIVNGKVYQTMILAPGTYTFKTNFRMVNGAIDTNHSEADAGAAYLLVARGNNLPNVTDVETSSNTLVYEQIVAGKDPGEFEISFTIEHYTQVSVGLATTQASGDPGRFANITSFEFTEN